MRDEQKTKESEQIFRTIFENAADGILLADVETKKFYMGNQVICQMLGYDLNELTALSVIDIHPEQDTPHVMEQFDKQARGELTSAKDIPVKRKNGSVLFADINAFPITLDGKTYLMGIFRDVTEHRKAEEEIKKFKTIADKAGHGVSMSDLKGNLIYVNDSFAKMHQYRASELIGKNLSIFHNEDQMKRANQLNKQLKQKGGYVAEEVWHKRRDNSFFPTLMNATLIRNEEGEPQLLACTAIDITEHKRAEEALRERESRLRYLVSSCPATIYTCKASGNYDATYISENVVSQTGYEARDYMEIPGFWFDHIHPDDKKAIFDRLSALFEKESLSYEYRFLHKDGSYRWMIDEMNLVRDEQGNPLEIIGSWLDITERKKAEDALLESELRYRTLFETLPVGVGLATLDGRIIDANSAMQRMIGRSLEEIKQSNVRDTYHNPDERTRLLKQVQQDGLVRDFEAELKHKDGSTYYTNLNVTAMKIRNETVLVTVAKDITEQRNMERVLAESEEKYRTLVECAGDPIFTIDERGVLLFANKVAAETLGHLPEGLVGKTLWDIFPKETADRQAANVRKVIETGQGINTISLTEVQNKPRWYNTTIEPLRDDHGRATAAMVIAREVDDMIRAEVQIRNLSSAVESSISGIAIGDAKGNLTYVNRSFLEMWGYNDENEVLGRNAVEFWQIPDEGSKVIDTLQDTGGWIGELTAKRKDYTTFDVQICATLVTDGNGKPISMMGSFVDISETKRKEEELSRYRGQMARAEQLASLGTLSATIAHQLTQPLTVIRLSMDNALDELEASSSSQNVIRKLKDSVIQVSNITSIIERFRNFARKSSGKTVTEVNLKAVAVRIASLLSESARSANIMLRARNMDDLPCPWMNENDLEQLFFALIENAIQAADGKKNRQLVISAAVKDKHIELRLSDNCGGVAPENIDKIFEPFFTTKPRGQGTGLGLCIVQDVVSRNGGRVRVESEVGKGTTFTIRLPFEQGTML